MSYSSDFDMPNDQRPMQEQSFDWFVSDVRSFPFRQSGGPSEEDWPTYYMARHPISVEDREALSKGGIGSGRAGIFISDAKHKAIWWSSLMRQDFNQMVISEQCPPNNTFPDCLRMKLTNPKGLVVTFSVSY